MKLNPYALKKTNLFVFQLTARTLVINFGFLQASAKCLCLVLMTIQVNVIANGMTGALCSAVAHVMTNRRPQTIPSLAAPNCVVMRMAADNTGSLTGPGSVIAKVSKDVKIYYCCG